MGPLKNPHFSLLFKDIAQCFDYTVV
jgi:hypothetical protein